MAEIDKEKSQERPYTISTLVFMLHKQGLKVSVSDNEIEVKDKKNSFIVKPVDLEGERFSRVYVERKDETSKS